MHLRTPPFRPSWIVFAIFFSLINFAPSAHVRAQSPTARIEGIVFDASSNKPVESASIVVMGIDSFRALSDSSGKFVLTEIPASEPFQLYTITITASGFGAWTMRDVLLYPNITRTLTVRLILQDQVIIAGLPRALTGELQSPLDLSEPRRAPAYFSNSIPPSTIRVGITAFANCGNWLNAGQPIIRVDTIAFDSYVKNVLPNEWLASWGNTAPESLRAGAMAVKMFGWWRVNLGGVRPQGAEVVDNTCDQRYIANSNDPRTDAAVDATWQYKFRKSGVVFEIHYLATVSQCQSSPYQPCMPQVGTYSDALNGMNWQGIVHKYYDPVQIDGSTIFLPLMAK